MFCVCLVSMPDNNEIADKEKVIAVYKAPDGTEKLYK